MIIFMLCLNLLIHSNYGHTSNHGKHSPSEKSAEEDLVDFYGKSDEYSNESGNLKCFFFFNMTISA